MACNNKEGIETKEDRFRRTLSKICKCITNENLSQLKFCCADIIPDGIQEKLKTSERLFRELERRDKLSPNKLDFLIDLLHEVGLDALGQELKELNHGENLKKVQDLKSKSRLLIKEEKYSEAIRKCEEALKVLDYCSPSSDETVNWKSRILRTKANCHKQKGQYEKGVVDCNEALKQDPQDFKSKLLLAQLQIALDNLEEAARELNVLMKAKPKDPEVLLLNRMVNDADSLEEEQHKEVPPSSESPSDVTEAEFKRKYGDGIIFQSNCPQCGEEVDLQSAGTHSRESGSIQIYAEDEELICPKCGFREEEEDSYPRRILLVCDKWSGWHQSVYSVNRHLCRSFAKVKDVQVACLVLEVSEKDKTKASKEGIFIFEPSKRSGIPERDKRLFLMHEDFPFQADIVIGHGMITGAEAADLARKLNSKYLHIFYRAPESDTDAIEDEIDLGQKADFVAALGPHLTKEWSNTLDRQVIEIIPGLPYVSHRNSVPALNYRCVIVESINEYKTNGLEVAIQALRDCKKRGRPIKLIVQGCPREIKREVQSKLKEELSSKCDVCVTSYNASIESVEGEIRAVSLVLIPALSEEFGVRGLEAIAAGVPALISSSLGIAEVLLNHFDKKFWHLLCSVEDEDAYESWSDHIDTILDAKDIYFGLIQELRLEWGKKFSWDFVVNNILKQLSKSGHFSNITADTESNKQPLFPSLSSGKAREFVDKEMKLIDRGRKFVLIVSPVGANAVSSLHYLTMVPWIAVFDFDVDSAKTGCLANCEKRCNEMGMKVCRIVAQKEQKGKFTLPHGMPWFLLEGTQESNKNMTEHLVWLKNVFSALENTHHVPITILILWKAQEECKPLTRKLGKLLNIIEASSLQKQVKVASVLISGHKEYFVECIEEDWSTTIYNLPLKDVCCAINETVAENPLVNESLEFELPVADLDGSANVQTGVLPNESRWINAELEVLYKSAGDVPEHGPDDAYHFYRGGTISWYALAKGYAIERDNLQLIKAKISELLPTAGTLRLKLAHQRGTGGTTAIRKLLFDFHLNYPCVTVQSINHTETAPAIKVLSDFCKLPVFVLIDCKHVHGEEFDLEMLYNSLSNLRVPCIILEVVHQHRRKRGKQGKELRASEILNESEKENFVQIYSEQKREKLQSLRQLQRNPSDELQIPFYYALVTYEDKFTALKPFVEDCLSHSEEPDQRQVLIFLAMAHHFGRIPISEAILTSYFEAAPRGMVLRLEDVLTESSIQLLIEEDGDWRPRHDLIGLEMLHKLLGFGIHRDNWIQNIADEAIDFISHMPERQVSVLLINRIAENDYFSPLINDIPDDDDAIRVFEKAIDKFPDNMHFKVHLGRFYSIRKEAAGFDMAVKYTDEGIACADNETSRVARAQCAQMKGVVYSRQVGYLIKQGSNLDEIIKFAEQGVQWFRRAVSICPDIVDGYIPEVSMMCKLFEHIDKTTGSLHNYLLNPSCHSFVLDGISQTSDTLESVPDSDNYSIWKTRLLCLGLRKDTKMTKMRDTMKLLEQLRESGKASRGPINRKIADMKISLCRQNNKSLGSIAKEAIELLTEALKYDPAMEPTMRIWVRIAPYLPVHLPEAETRIFKWCMEAKSVHSYLYKYIVACIHVLNGSRHYNTIMKNTHYELNTAIKAINRLDVGRVRHPDKPVVWLGQQSVGMSQLEYLNLPDNITKQRKQKNILPPEYTKNLRRLTGAITRTDPKLGEISVKGALDVKFRTDLCDPPLTSATFCNRKVQFYLGFNFFGVDAYNVTLIPE